MKFRYKKRVLGAVRIKNFVILAWTVLIQITSVTDKWTDRRTPRPWLRRAKHSAIARKKPSRDYEFYHPGSREWEITDAWLLLMLQCTLQQYVDDLFATILHVEASFPPVVKFLFDQFDNAARTHSVSDAEVVHTWKTNRFI